jgi:cytochrome c oxidase subunit 2
LEPEDSPHHSVSIEIVWSVVPSILMVMMFWYGFEDYVERRTMPKDAEVIDVVAKKWDWTFRHSNGAEIAGRNLQDPSDTSTYTLHVPPYEPVVFRMTSLDVLHSFSVPSMRVKMDVIPGRYSYAWFEAQIPGTYELYCTEYCGTSHSQMLSKVYVHPTRADYDEWVAAQAKPTDPMALGEYLYKIKCASCHSVDGSAVIGPSFLDSYGAERQFVDGSSGVMDDNYIRESILYPGAKVVAGYANQMTAFAGQLDEAELTALISFIQRQTSD